jgi:hypothetical protein
VLRARRLQHNCGDRPAISADGVDEPNANCHTACHREPVIDADPNAGAQLIGPAP